MGAPVSGPKAAEQVSADSLLTAFKNIDASERRRHASVLNYWLSIRGDKEFPPLHDLDPLELSDAGPNSILLELISGGHDAEIRHMGEALRDDDWPERILDAETPSALSCIAKKLPIVAISRDFLAFEDEYDGGDGPTRCWVTLLPLSAGGAWVDYVYALVSLEAEPSKTKSKGKKAEAPETVAEEPAAVEVAGDDEMVVDEPVAKKVEDPVTEEPKSEEAPEFIENVIKDAPEAPFDHDGSDEPVAAVEEPAEQPAAKPAPGFSKLLDSLAGLTGFYGSQPVKVEPVVYEPERFEEPIEPFDEPFNDEVYQHDAPARDPVTEQVPEPAEEAVEEIASDDAADEPAIVEEPQAPAEPEPIKSIVEHPTRAPEGTLQDKLTDVRAKADEARMAKLRANSALYEGLGAAYDFALDAEEAPEEYLRLVEAQGLKIQLRSPMKPVVKLAFDGMCDDMTIKQLEAVLAWAFDEELPRGTLAERIEAAGGIGPILNGDAKAA